MIVKVNIEYAGGGILMKASMKDVAKHAQVSVATVSHVINNTRFVSEETRKKVMDSIKALEYVPDLSARSFKTGRKNLIGIIVPDISNPVWAIIIEEVESVLAKDGYKLLIVNTKETEKTDKTTQAAVSETTEAAEENSELDLRAAAGKHHVEINVKDYGTINVELDGDAAPVTVANFLDLAGNGFYDGLTFHRIISGFMIQGGDPLGTGMGGSEREIKGEFDSNGVKNTLSHTRGAISMARSQRKDSASSQFFIVQSDSTYLDGQYAAFGHVTEGMDIVDQICKDAKPTDNNGTISADEQPVMTSVTIID